MCQSTSFIQVKYTHTHPCDSLYSPRIVETAKNTYNIRKLNYPNLTCVYAYGLMGLPDCPLILFLCFFSDRDSLLITVAIYNCWMPSLSSDQQANDALHPSLPHRPPCTKGSSSLFACRRLGHNANSTTHQGRT